MRILLLGEYSGLYNNLSKGLKELGHEVVLASDGDGWKNFHRDINMLPSGGSVAVKAIKRIMLEKSVVQNLEGFDVVQVINPLVFSRFVSAKPLFQTLKKKNGKIFLSAVGDDYFYWKAFRNGEFKFSPHAGNLEDLGRKSSVWEGAVLKRRNLWLLDQIDGVIAGLADYYLPYNGKINVPLIYIPFPYEIKDIQFRQIQKSQGEPIVFFHGIQSRRKGFKGTQIILDAMALAKEKYGSQLQFSKVADLPFEEYKKSFANADVIIDQTSLYSPAMNALMAMASGKVVMGGFSKECMDINRVTKSPVVALEPSVENVFENICSIMEGKFDLSAMSRQSREYVAVHHDPVTVAKQYVAFWESNS